jgi:hypothetical protein
MGAEAVNTRSVHVRSGLKTIDETSRIKEGNRWKFIRRVAVEKEKENVRDEMERFVAQDWRKRRS